MLKTIMKTILLLGLFSPVLLFMDFDKPVEAAQSEWLSVDEEALAETQKLRDEQVKARQICFKFARQSADTQGTIEIPILSSKAIKTDQGWFAVYHKLNHTTVHGKLEVFEISCLTDLVTVQGWSAAVAK